MIRSFADPEAQLIWNGDRSRKLPPDIQQRAFRRLRMLDAANSLDDLRNPPSNRLHALTDDRSSQHSISINMQWRICFVWKDDGAHDVEITDYH
ncbi:type II toxin-antitoxin system RelE/ParE family toxin [Sphingobium phenoxybenzoativorans]|uniref:Type II toxin-antitoxin system RelE/ParE family toxin n=1 Tax=Sphingobium phenoxybenzoativorans TaxID=1592790 RepID=A0A975K734_9SPHN|nr:type II toxin-antitoxin system RelE/ParE family toxin [Sphingobium phenoxybenzoativorans]QUT06015.1 type II toxin-antitoxin system RelE/ParE family toxin [Sphingobium phenoxybenzoativorans]